MKTRLWFICILFLLALPSIASAYQGVVITAKYKPVTGGYQYYLTVNNDTKPADSLYVQFFDLFLVPATDLISPTTNWSARTWFNSYVEWSTGPSWMDWPKGIAPGHSLSGFVLTSTKLPSQIRYSGAIARDAGQLRRLSIP